MIMTRTMFLKCRPLLLMLCGIILLMLGQVNVNAQPQPPRPIRLYTIQSMNFGAFYQGFSGGTAIIYANGSRSSTGDVHLLMLGFSFVNLSGSNGGSMKLHIGDAFPASPFITSVAPSGRTQVSIGGILTVANPGANPVGAYNGSFTVIFNQQ